MITQHRQFIQLRFDHSWPCSPQRLALSNRRPIYLDCLSKEAPAWFRDETALPNHLLSFRVDSRHYLAHVTLPFRYHWHLSSPSNNNFAISKHDRRSCQSSCRGRCRWHEYVNCARICESHLAYITCRDAVILDLTPGCPKPVLATHKAPTTPDIASGIQAAIKATLEKASVDKSQIQAVAIGTTSFVNSLIERDGSKLERVAVIRLSGPFSKLAPPFVSFPYELRNVLEGPIFFTQGGLQVDGTEITTVSHNPDSYDEE